MMYNAPGGKMNEWTQIGKLVLIVGFGLVVLGGLLILGAKLFDQGSIPWLGKLPGDIRIERKGLSCYFPLATSILVSLLLTVILNVILRLLRRR
jgi:hypothetical protein